jgi:hypothetical protein
LTSQRKVGKNLSEKKKNLEKQQKKIEPKRRRRGKIDILHGAITREKARRGARRQWL